MGTCAAAVGAAPQLTARKIVFSKPSKPGSAELCCNHQHHCCNIPVVDGATGRFGAGQYVPMRMQEYNNEELSAELVAALPDFLRPLLCGSQKWSGRNSRFRRLEEPLVAPTAAAAVARL